MNEINVLTYNKFKFNTTTFEYTESLSENLNKLSIQYNQIEDDPTVMILIEVEKTETNRLLLTYACYKDGIQVFKESTLVSRKDLGLITDLLHHDPNIGEHEQTKNTLTAISELWDLADYKLKLNEGRDLNVDSINGGNLFSN